MTANSDWIPIKLLPNVGVPRLWQTDSGLMFVGSLSDDKRLVYLSDDETRYMHVEDCVAHRILPPQFKWKDRHYDVVAEALEPNDGIASEVMKGG